MPSATATQAANRQCRPETETHLGALALPSSDFFRIPNLSICNGEKRVPEPKIEPAKHRSRYFSNKPSRIRLPKPCNAAILLMSAIQSIIWQIGFSLALHEDKT
jgi:hypothetical protein